MPREPQTREIAEWAKIEEKGRFVSQGKESGSQTFKTQS